MGSRQGLRWGLDPGLKPPPGFKVSTYQVKINMLLNRTIRFDWPDDKREMRGRAPVTILAGRIRVSMQAHA